MSGYQRWQRRPKKKQSLDELRIIDLFMRSSAKLGYRRLKMSFERKTGERINVKKVRRIMRDFGLVTKVRRKSKFRAIFKAGEANAVTDNLVNRRFGPEGADTILSTDISELRFAYGQRAYLAAVKDLSTKEIVSYAVAARPTIDLALDNLRELLRGLPEEKRKNIIVHSDQGFQFTSYQFRQELEKLGVRQSMSRKGNCLDNAPIESFFGHLKDELEFRGCKNLGELRRNVTKYMDFYNHERPQWGLKQKTPAEAGVSRSLVL